MRISWLPALMLSGSLTGVCVAAIPVDHFQSLTFEAPIENRVRAGDPLHFAGHVADPSITAIQFSFDNGTARHDFFFLVGPDGRFERDLVFLEDQQGSYDVHAFGGARGESIPHLGTYTPIVVDGVRDPIQWPTAFFDGIRLERPLPIRWPVGRSLQIEGQIIDPQVQQVRIDIDTPGSPRSVVIARDQGRFSTPLRFSSADVGDTFLEVVTGLHDGNFWGRGRISIDLTQAPLPRLRVSAMSVSIRPGSQVSIPLSNTGDGDLLLHGSDIEGPFSVASVPAQLASGARGAVVVRHDGAAGETGWLILHSDDPERPRIEIALTSLASLQSQAADWQRVEGDLPLTDGEQIVILYSTVSDQERHFRYALGQPAVALGALSARRPVHNEELPDFRDLGEGELRRRESELARRVAAAGGLPAARPAASQAKIGDQRGFTFDQFGRVPTQRIAATVLAISEHAVAWGHDGSGAGNLQMPTTRIQQILDQFDADFDLLVASLGAPSDVDGDDKTHFLFSPLVDSTGFGGFVDASSILPFSTGGNGNQTDLIFISLGEPELSYRALLAHEFQHLISFNQHVLVRFGASEVSWLNEGLSHLAEDLVDGFGIGNAERVATYLADPSAVSLVGDASTNGAKRGAAYLFVRSLVDRFGPQVLLSLIGTGLADRDNLEAATGEAFEDLLSRFGAQLATSGTDLGQHPRFDFTFDLLSPGGQRGFGPPHMTRLDAGGGAVGMLPASGLSFHRIHSQGASTLGLEIDASARAHALIIPIPSGYEIPVSIRDTFFRHVVLDQPLSAVVRSGDAIHIAGQIDTTLFPAQSQQRQLVLEYQQGDTFPAFPIRIDGDRFERDIVFARPQQGDFSLAAFARWLLDDEYHFEWLGTFSPARVAQGEGIVYLPVRYFDRLVLDQPWPTTLAPTGGFDLNGRLIAIEGEPDFIKVQVDLAGPHDTVSVEMEVIDSHFEGRLELIDQDLGSHVLNVFGQDLAGEFTWLGGSDHVEVRHRVVTAIAASAASVPDAAQLGNSYPNPFNSHTIIPFQLTEGSDVSLAIFNLAGQKVADWKSGSQSAGVYQWRWDARSSGGQALASGVYLVQLQGENVRLTKKLLLLR